MLGNVYQGIQSKVVPFVVVRDGLGDVVAVRSVEKAENPDHAQVAADLKRWVRNVRTVYTDVKALKALILDAYAMTAKQSAAAQALGCALPEDFPEKLLMGTARMPDYLPSMYHDRYHNRPMELEAIYAAPLAAAAQQGVSMPRTEMIYRLLRFLEQRNGA